MEQSFDNGPRERGSEYPYAPAIAKRKPIGLIIALLFAGILCMAAVAIIANIVVVRSVTGNVIVVEEAVAVQAVSFHGVYEFPHLMVVSGYDSVTDVRFPVDEVQYLNVRMESNNGVRISTHNEDTIRLYIWGHNDPGFEFNSDRQILNIHSNDSHVNIFIPHRQFDPVFRDVTIDGRWGSVSILGGNHGNTFLSESLSVSTSNNILLEDIMVNLFISADTSGGDIVLRNVIGDQNRLNLHSDRGDIFIMQ